MRLMCVGEMLSSPRSMLRYVILLNIHKGIQALTSAADFLFPWQGTQPAVLQLFPRYSVDIYKCTNASELISHSRSPCLDSYLYQILSIPIWSMLTRRELTKWELTKWEVDEVGRFTI